MALAVLDRINNQKSLVADLIVEKFNLEKLQVLKKICGFSVCIEIS